MEFNKTDFESLHLSKITKSLYGDSVISDYFFCYQNKMILINRSKGFYRVLSSVQCGFESLFKERVFNVIFQDKNLEECIKEFKFLVEIIVRSN